MFYKCAKFHYELSAIELFLGLLYNDNNNRDNKIAIKRSKLKRMRINSCSYMNSLRSFEDYLCQLKTLDLIGNITTIEDVVEYLSPSILRPLAILCKDISVFDGLDIIKTKFSRLKPLNLKYYGYQCGAIETNSNVTFIPNLKLEVEGELNNFAVNHFGDLKELKSMKLIDTCGLNFDFNENNKKITKSSNIVTLGYFDPEITMSYDLLNSSLLEVFYFSMEALKSISLLSNIQTIRFYDLVFDIKEILDKPCSNKSGFYNGEYNPMKRSYIKQTMFREFNSTLEDFSYLLSLFSNLKVLDQVFYFKKKHKPGN